MLYDIKLIKNTSESACKRSTQWLVVSLHGQYVLIGCWNGFEVCPKERPLSRAGKRQIQWILEFHKWGYLQPNDLSLYNYFLDKRGGWNQERGWIALQRRSRSNTKGKWVSWPGVKPGKRTVTKSITLWYIFIYRIWYTYTIIYNDMQYDTYITLYKLEWPRARPGKRTPTMECLQLFAWLDRSALMSHSWSLLSIGAFRNF